MPEYVGPERRRDYIELDQALEKVDHLHGAVTSLANAMSNAVPRRELEDLRDEVKKDFLYKIYLQLGLTVLFVFFFVIFVNAKFNSLDTSIKKGHGVIACLLAQPETSRTGSLAATALVTCEQTVK